ncbi:hypothetical protein BCR37DRAFT_385807 [Protomyces lactucae-debilis]|uniref:Uncharacterized protein n=1 Tax=Protomyces lactucae-debilis TaxID=2754530 RepID=A0A1Y2FQU4_PROLT|nr:uncharacterized protein BCR37DRAFT_385807 [Protomyces lactucae-debilis]ORY86361.1 hypothetical protein BCR37DRAFT_385807 [Protomyces lactucae-debilis]
MSPAEGSSSRLKRHAGLLSLISVFVLDPSLELKTGADYQKTPQACNLVRVCGKTLPENCKPVDMIGTKCIDQNWFAIQTWQKSGSYDDCSEKLIRNRAPPEGLESLVAGYCPSKGQSVSDRGSPPLAKLFWDKNYQTELHYAVKVDPTTGKHRLVLGGCDEE